MTTGPQVGMRPPDQNGVRTPYDHRAMPPGGGRGGGMNPMMQRQQAMAQQMRGGMGGRGKPQRPPNPGGSRMPMRGGMRGGGRGMY
jgi:hypothetical protein